VPPAINTPAAAGFGRVKLEEAVRERRPSERPLIGEVVLGCVPRKLPASVASQYFLIRTDVT
jgi:hypothetical protein